MSEVSSYVLEVTQKAKESVKQLRTLNTDIKNKVLYYLVKLLEDNIENIIRENNKDIEVAKKNNLSQALVDRLLLNEKRILGMSQSLQEIATLTDPVGEVIEGKILPNGLHLIKKRVPIGVLCIIFESRPNVTIDIGALGLKSSNVVILRGGKEAIHSNTYLTSLFQESLEEHSISPYAVQLIEKTDRELVLDLLKQNKMIDLIVPRGGSSLIQFVTENSSIPVIKHDAGICHIYVDENCDFSMASSIILNGKVQRPSVCNAVETLILHKGFDKELSIKILKDLQNHNVILHADKDTESYFNEISFRELYKTQYKTEYLDLNISVKAVSSLEDAILHIQENSSGHSEAIISNNIHTISKFQENLDSAAIFVNCSTRFHDGGP